MDFGIDNLALLIHLGVMGLIFWVYRDSEED